MRIAPCLIAFLVAASGCATTYAPIPGRRISIVMDGGTPKLTKQGRTYSMTFGSGLVEAVADHPEAERHAIAFRNGQIASLALILGEVAAFAGGVSAMVLGIGESSSTNSWPAATTIGIGLYGIGLALGIAALAVSANAQPHFYDAINIYNDAVSPPMEPVPSYQAPTQAPTN